MATDLFSSLYGSISPAFAVQKINLLYISIRGLFLPFWNYVKILKKRGQVYVCDLKNPEPI